MTTKGPAPTRFSYKKSTPLSNMDETIIRKAELDILILGDDSSKTYDEFELSSKKYKRDINIYGCDSSVSVAWKKNIIDFSSRTAIAVNKSFLSKSI